MKSNLDAAYKTDESLEENGVWFEVAPGVSFCVRRMAQNNPRSKKAMARHYKPHAAAVQNGTLTPEKERSILTKIFIEVSMVDWKGVEIDGKETPYSPEAAYNLFMKLPELCDTLRIQAEDSKNYMEDLGNS